jgi:hypothetical protein
MKDFISYIKEDNAISATATLQKELTQKTLSRLQEERKRVAVDCFSEETLEESGTVDDYHRIATQHGYKKSGQTQSATSDAHTGAGGFYGSGGTIHRYEHPSGSKLGIHHNSGVNRGDKDRVSFIHDEGHGKTKFGKTPQGLSQHLTQVHKGVKEGIENPNSSGQGHDASHSSNPHHATIAKHGYEYSHSTPVNHTHGKVIHHTYKHPKDRDQNVSVWQNQHGGHNWSTSRSGSGVTHSGNSSDELDRHLKGHVARWMKKKK